MKRHSKPLLQRKRTDIEGASSARRIGTAASLKSQDGYDWLREIKRFQARCAQPPA